jgi:hypothetical protein
LTGSKETNADQAEILSGIKKTNPFFSGMKPISPSPTPEVSSLTPIPTLNPKAQHSPEIPEKESPQTPTAGAPINRDMTYILHPELQKVQPINIAEMEGGKPSKSSQLAESVMEKSITLLKGGVSLDKKLSFEKSPLAKDEILPSRSDVQKTGILQPPQIRLNPLEGFSKQKDRMQILLEEEAEKLGEAIRNLGESLSRPLCEKFIEQLRIRYGKTNLSENDIEKAAKIYVEQRHRQRSA